MRVFALAVILMALISKSLEISHKQTSTHMVTMLNFCHIREIRHFKIRSSQL
jgi:hypothetical protein